MSVVIVYSGFSGGVRASSISLSRAFSKKNILNYLFNIKEQSGPFFVRWFCTVRALYPRKRELIILQHFDAIVLGFLLKLLGFTRLVNVVHTDLVSYYRSVNCLKKSVLKIIFFLIKNQKIVFVSKEAELKAKSFFKLKYTNTIYNIHNFDTHVHRTVNKAGVLTLGSVSRLHAGKNIDLTIRVLKEINKRDKHVELLIYGDGEQSVHLNKYIEKLGCGDFIRMKGASSNKEKMYGSFDALVSFSSIEGFGMTILESIDYGKPVLFTDCSSGPRELMAPETNPMNKTTSYEKTNVGYLVKPVLDVVSYSDALTRYENQYVSILECFINDVREQKFSMAFDYSNFSEDTVVEKWLKEIKG